ncbi:hypothetical protein OMP40_13460 [Cohnella rhizosphaerae]|uniref:Uncharacterized protein n=1 Tax=Cohnella rhizosphaerae TaxID=1457232 RepID=A0A9X4QTE0_9BACL|nr:hypothetical protein [Cohnella rhizosphaerae]MDG0810238.1 hypothetical protein [Cohnella rhizosphaerae]
MVVPLTISGSDEATNCACSQFSDSCAGMYLSEALLPVAALKPSTIF